MLTAISLTFSVRGVYHPVNTTWPERAAMVNTQLAIHFARSFNSKCPTALSASRLPFTSILRLTPRVGEFEAFVASRSLIAPVRWPAPPLLLYDRKKQQPARATLLQKRWKDDDRRRAAAGEVGRIGTRMGLAALLALFVFPPLGSSGRRPGSATSTAQSFCAAPESPLPDAPKPQKVVHDNSKIGPCRVMQKFEPEGTAEAFTAGEMALEAAGFQPRQDSSSTDQSAAPAELPPCPPQPIINWFARFLNGPQVKPLTPKEKGAPRRAQRPRPLQRHHHPRQLRHLPSALTPTPPTALECPASGATSASATHRT